MFKHKRLIIVFFAILAFLGASFGFLSTKYVVPIIMYHSVSPDAAPQNMLAVSVKSFERQMRFLKDNRYNVVSLESLAKMVRENKKVPFKTIAITFDDGYKNNYAYAFPVLKKYGLIATIFPIINEISRPQGDRLSWDELKEMQDSGVFVVGSHTIGAEPLVNIKSAEELKRQVFESKNILEGKLGSPVNLFSYPEGKFTPEIRDLVIGAGYKAAVATNPGKKFSSRDIFALKRLRISRPCDSMFTFLVETSGFYNFMRENRRK